MVELVITVLILSVLSILATRSYLKTVRVANRTDAITAITTTSQQLERCFSQYFSYLLTSGCATLPTSPPAFPATTNILATFVSPKGYYKITVSVANPPGTTVADPATAGQTDQYVITATAQPTTLNPLTGASTSTSNTQYKDTGCRTFYLTSLGGQFSADSAGNINSGSGGVSSCWSVN